MNCVDVKPVRLCKVCGYSNEVTSSKCRQCDVAFMLSGISESIYKKLGLR